MSSGLYYDIMYTILVVYQPYRIPQVCAAGRGYGMDEKEGHTGPRDTAHRNNNVEGTRRGEFAGTAGGAARVTRRRRDEDRNDDAHVVAAGPCDRRTDRH
ncbi:hypothetical protein QTP88_014794 [Uroleucon formosanum]